MSSVLNEIICFKNNLTNTIYPFMKINEYNFDLNIRYNKNEAIFENSIFINHQFGEKSTKYIPILNIQNCYFFRFINYFFNICIKRLINERTK